MLVSMCRNIRVLHNFEPPTTKEEVRAAALQYVRKVSGYPKPPVNGQEAFEKAIDEIAAMTERLLGALPARAPARTRQNEVEKARARWQKRETRVRTSSS